MNTTNVHKAFLVAALPFFMVINGHGGKACASCSTSATSTISASGTSTSRLHHAAQEANRLAATPQTPNNTEPQINYPNLIKVGIAGGVVAHYTGKILELLDRKVFGPALARNATIAKFLSLKKAG